VRLALESGGELLARGLNRDGSAQASVERPKNLAHTALAEFVLDLVPSQANARRQLGDGDGGGIIHRNWLIEESPAGGLH
jgi:hypothetical protein